MPPIFFLSRGIETIRCIGNHGLDVEMLVSLAKIFEDRSKRPKKRPEEQEYEEARADLYWKTALPLLEKLKNGLSLSQTTNKLFEYQSKSISPVKISKLIEEGKLFSGIRLVKKAEYERALQIFETLRDPHASYYQSKIYKTMAKKQMSQDGESVTSEMRSQNVILLSRARDCLYLTLDRLRDPSVDRKHSLNAILGTEIDKIERMLARIDPDLDSNRNDFDEMSDVDSFVESAAEDYLQPMCFNGTSTTHNDSHLLNLSATPLRHEQSFRREAKPSPERLDAQIRQLIASKDPVLGQINKQNKNIMESHKLMFEEMKSFKVRFYHLHCCLHVNTFFKQIEMLLNTTFIQNKIISLGNHQYLGNRFC